MESPKLILTRTVWRITSFQWKDRANNEHFVAYTFIFNTDGSIDAIHNNIKEYGKYSKRNNILEIRFSSQPLIELNNNWTITEHTTTSLNLKGLNPNDNSSEFLIFEKSSSIPPTEM